MTIPVKLPLIAVATALFLGAAAGAGCGREISAEDVEKSIFHYRLAGNFYKEGNIAMTRKELHDSLKLDPSNAEARFLQGIMNMGLRDFEGAEREFRMALQFKPDLREARNNLGLVLIELHNPTEAITTLEPLLQDPLYPTPYLAHANIGRAFMEMGDLESARKAYDMAVFLNPKFCLGYLNLGHVFLKKHMVRDAQENYEKVTRFCPDFGESYYHLGVIHQKAGRTTEAMEAFEKCASLLKDSPTGKRCMARAAGGQAE
ncbi:MAG TPA: tetratricopeptide repeat protein [Myxococcota bacterium]|nr:tetratricopeptide repeat protein [Myxococcota bacterium]HOH76188.1 tetratricopeptide repeat protein [Myxococcota bacterium]